MNDFEGAGGVGVGVGLGVGLGVPVGVGLGVGFGFGLALVGVADGVAEWLGGGGALDVCWAAGVGDGDDERVSAGEGASEAARCFFFAFLVVRRCVEAEVEA